MRTLSASPMRTLSGCLYYAILDRVATYPSMLTPTRPPADVVPPLRLDASAHSGAAPTRRPRLRRIVAGAALLCLIPAVFSYVQAVTARSNSNIGIRTVEWLRDHGARGLVNEVETFYYSLNAPAKGGPALRSLPEQAGTALAPHPVRAHRHGPRLPTAADPADHPPGAARRGRVARHVSPRRRAAAGPRDELPHRSERTRSSSPGSPGSTTAEPPPSCIRASRSRLCGLSSRGPEEVPLRLRPHARRDLQQRLQDEGRDRRSRDRRAHVHTAAERPRHVRPLSQRPRRRDLVDGRSDRGAGHRLRPSEPAADRQPRDARTRICPTARSGDSRSATRFGSGARPSASTAAAICSTPRPPTRPSAHSRRS